MSHARHHRAPRAGFVLLPVLLFLTLVATAAFLMTREGTMAAQVATAEAEARQARYLAEAGFSHAYWQVQDAHCSAFDDLPVTSFAGGSYSAAVASTQATSTFTAPADQDTWINEGNPTTNYGSDAELRVESDPGGGGNERGLYRFDLSAVPTGWRVVSATLRLTMTDIDEDAPVNVHRVTAGWTEAGATWANTATDFDPAVLAAIPVQASSPAQVNVPLTGLVQEWLDGMKPNDGVMLIATSDGTESRFASREGSNPGEDPELEIVAAPADTPIRAAITATGSHGAGAERSLSRSDLRVYQQPGTEVLQPGASDGKDTWLYNGQPTWNFGSQTKIQVQASNDKRALLEFALPAIPPQAEVTQSLLSLYVEDFWNAGTVKAYRVTTDWLEGTCPGAGCTANGATWLTSDGLVPWGSPGGDHDPAALASAPVTGAGQWVVLDVTAQTAAWVRGEQSNRGVLLRGSDGVNAHFSSSEASDPTRAPKLSVTYACECGQGETRQSITLQPGVGGEDAYIWDGAHQDKNFGASAKLMIDDGGALQNTLLRFDLSSLPPGAIVGDATVSLYLEGGNDLVDGQLDVHRSTRSWVEGDQDDETTTLGVTFNSAELGVPWTNPGGDFDPSASASVVAPTLTPGWIDWEVTALVDDWVQDAHPNDGLVIRWGGGIVDKIEFTSGDAPDPSRHPKLELSYTCPCGVDCGGGPSGPFAGGDVLMVVVNPASLTAQEAAKQALIGSWGFTVNLIDVHDSVVDFELAAADNDVAFVTEDIISSDLGTKLSKVTIGVVTEEDNLVGEFGLGPGIDWGSGTDLEIVDVGHYITEVFAPGPLNVLSAVESIATVTGWPAPSASWLGTLGTGGDLSLTALESGATTHLGGPSFGRRAMLPWGGNDFDVANLTADGLTIFRRALQWGAATPPFTTSVRVSASDDDAEERADTSMYLNSSDLELTEDGSNQTVGTRFAGVAVPAGATIEGAHIEFTVDETSSGATSVSFRGEDADDPGSFSSASSDITSRPTTAESVDWASIPAWNDVDRVWTSPNLAPIVQALVDRPGWAAGQAMVFIVTGSGTRFAESYDGEPDSAPRLLIHYSGVAPPPPPPPPDCVADDFETDDYAGSTGSLPWSGDWQEVGESDGPDSGDEQVVSWDGSLAVRVQDDNNNGEGVERGADISSFTTATLSFVYQRSGLDDSEDDFVRVRVSSNGGGSWTTLETITEPPGTDSSWQSASYDVSAWISSDFMVRFRTSEDMGGSDRVYFDEVEVCDGP